MGGVQSVNEGPAGETFEYFSSCGPIVADGFEAFDPKYHLITEVPGGIPDGCPTEVCVKAGTLEFGPPWEQKIGIGLVWFTVISSLALWLYYTYQTINSTCGWEEFYVVNMETLKVCIELKLEFDSPAMIYHTNGAAAPWIRYAEWLCTCPVILIHLSNLTGLKNGYSRRTMFLLVSDLGCIVWGASAANARGAAKAIFFVIGLCYGVNTFYNAAKVYIESYHMVPKGRCRQLVVILAWMYYVSWGMFPMGFIAGPEGGKYLSYAGSTIVHTFADLLSKNLWGFTANYLRVCIHKHIITYGDLRKKVKVNVAGTEVEIEQYQEEPDEETVKYPTKELANRQSFINIRNQLQAQGVHTRASLDMSGMNMNMGLMPQKDMGQMPIRQGRVIIGVTDPSVVDMFKQAFGNIGVPYDVVCAMGPEQVWSTVQQAANSGGFDFVLLHPDYLRDRSGASLFSVLQQNNVKLAAYDVNPGHYSKDFVDTAGIQHYIMGPGLSGLGPQSAMMLVAQMQGVMPQMMNMNGFGTMGGMASAGSYTMGGIPAHSQHSTEMQSMMNQGTMGSMGMGGMGGMGAMGGMGGTMGSMNGMGTM